MSEKGIGETTPLCSMCGQEMEYHKTGRCSFGDLRFTTRILECCSCGRRHGAEVLFPRHGTGERLQHD